MEMGTEACIGFGRGEMPSVLGVDGGGPGSDREPIAGRNVRRIPRCARSTLLETTRAQGSGCMRVVGKTQLMYGVPVGGLQ